MNGIVTLFDTSVSSDNLGDQIIMDSVNKVVEELFDKEYIFRTSTHERISTITHKWCEKSDYILVGGTNILCSFARLRPLWRLRIRDFINLNRIILMGAGWNRYDQNMDILSRRVWNSILHSEMLHSVRDNYTLNQLKKMGIDNAINTTCPTLWNVSTSSEDYPNKKAENVVFTLTSHKRDDRMDEILITTLIRNYKKVFFWAQDVRDCGYFEKLRKDLGGIGTDIVILPFNLRSFDILLENEDVDYIGTRLHGGIRALQKNKRTIIIGIDNRAIEISRDTNINVLLRKNSEELEQMIYSKLDTNIKLYKESVARWKKQFLLNM